MTSDEHRTYHVIAENYNQNFKNVVSELSEKA
jgi:hypothetical protein